MALIHVAAGYLQEHFLQLHHGKTIVRQANLIFSPFQFAEKAMKAACARGQLHGQLSTDVRDLLRFCHVAFHHLSNALMPRKRADHLDWIIRDSVGDLLSGTGQPIASSKVSL